MLTAFGKELRKLRIDKGERILDMANRLGISPSYVSAIETGNRAIPDDLIDNIQNAYHLDGQAVHSLIEAKEISIREVKIDLNNMDETRRDFAVLLARRFDSFDEDSIKKIREIIEKSGEVNVTCNNK